MAAGVRTINGYDNSYPTVGNSSNTWNIGSATWNTTYRSNAASLSSIGITIPIAPDTSEYGDKEIRLVFKTSSTGFNLNITTLYWTVYGLSDVTWEKGVWYEVSFVPLWYSTSANAPQLGVIIKEWS